jgi:hypothetical protein
MRRNKLAPLKGRKILRSQLVFYVSNYSFEEHHSSRHVHTQRWQQQGGQKFVCFSERNDKKIPAVA